MNVKLTYAIFIALTCLAPDIFAAAAPPCEDSPLKILLETTGGSKIPFACRSMLLSKNTSCSEVLASHCPKACGMCPSYKCSDSEGNFLMRQGRDRDCSWLEGKNPTKQRIKCKNSSRLAKTCRATCKFCPSEWSQLYNDLTGEASGDQFGYASAISADGSHLIVGAEGHSDYTGQVRVYRDTGDSWEQVYAPLNGDANKDQFGWEVGLSENGSWIIVSAFVANKVKVFTDNGSSWEQVGQDLIGSAVGMSRTGSRIVIGDPSDNNNTGRVHVFDYNGATWEYVYETDLSGTTNGGHYDDDSEHEFGSRFGHAVGISADGFHIIISAPSESVNGITRTGQTKVFEDTGSSWMQLGQDLNGSAADDWSGLFVAMAGNGERVMIAAAPNFYYGQVKVFEFNSQGEWVHVHDRNFNGFGVGDRLGFSVGISHDGTKIVMGSYENGADTANYHNSGQVHVFKDNGTAWVQVGEEINGEAPEDYFGWSTGITGDGSRIVVGIPTVAIVTPAGTGKVQVFEIQV